MTVFVPNGESQGNTATWLLYSADEHDIDRRLIRTTRGGFNIPDELAQAIGLMEVAKPVQPPILPSEDRQPPAEWGEPLPKPDVELRADGKVYLTDEAFLREVGSDAAEVAEAVRIRDTTAVLEDDREVIRAWAKEQGLNPAEKGALKKAVIEAYRAAQAQE